MSLKKFNKFHDLTVKQQWQLKEVRIVVERLREEIIACQNSEEHIRIQLANTQNRLLALKISERQLIKLSKELNENKSHVEKMEKEIEKLKENLREQSRILKEKISQITQDLELIEENKRLKNELKDKDNAYYLRQMEHDSLNKEKDDTIKELRERLITVQNDLKNSKLERDAYKSELEICKIQKRKYEQTIRHYEMERSALLGSSVGNSPRASNMNVQSKRDHSQSLMESSVILSPSYDSLLQDNEVSSVFSQHNVGNLSTFNTTCNQSSQSNTSFKPKFSSKRRAKPLNLEIFGSPERKKKLYSKDDDEEELLY